MNGNKHRNTLGRDGQELLYNKSISTSTKHGLLDQNKLNDLFKNHFQDADRCLCSLSLKKRMLRSRTGTPQTSRLSAFQPQVSSRSRHNRHLPKYTMQSPPKPLAATNVTHIIENASTGIIRSVGICPPLPHQHVTNLNSNRNTNLLSTFNGTRKMEPPFPLVASSSSSHLVCRCTAVSVECRYQDHNVTDSNSTLSHSSPLHEQRPKCMFRGFRKDYTLGQVARSSSHMVMETSHREAAKTVSELEPYDFAFIKLTKESWTYAILACRYVNESQEQCLLFVFNTNGSTKEIKKPHWAELIRSVIVQDDNLEDGMGNDSRSNADLIEIAEQYRRQLRAAWVPDVIWVKRHEDDSSLSSLDSC
eukprot:CCRYP_002112-RA/>CCRYP_002112-RA protein AED:0.24 eAED:0.24 QI:677/1/1/1/0/0/2/136/361